LTIVGALFLAFVAIIPIVVTAITKVPMSFGGTAILIVVGVALETSKQLESHMLMRHYKGFLK
jgi:preprotein translocase subunit SecY